jgi:hypothetical protein
MRTIFLKMKILLVCVWLFLGFALAVSAQNTINVSGVVTDASGEPLPGVNIVIKGTLQGVITDFNGNYQIEVPDNNAILVFSYIGFTTSEVTVGDRREIDVVLEEDQKLIDEVLVIGYGTVTRKDVTTAVSSVSVQDLDKDQLFLQHKLYRGKLQE